MRKILYGALLCPQYYVGQVLSARVLRTEDQPGKKDSNLVFRLIELGVTEDEEADKEGGDDISSALTRLPWWGESNPKRGEVYRWGYFDGSLS